ncbi:MAG: ribosomal protein bacterial/organelle [Actinomycetia bacterium]|nr:ribosomal protein bacterial/organelle [Actinomycetes bacterium]
MLSGKDVGKRGTITRVIPDRERVIVTSPDLINVVKKHQKATKATMQGGIIDKEMPIHVSNVAYVCRSCGPTRLGFRFTPDGTKVRVCRKCGNDV